MKNKYEKFQHQLKNAPLKSSCQYKTIPLVTLKPLVEAIEQQEEIKSATLLKKSFEGINFSLQCVF